MIKVISIWVKNPISSYDRVKSLEGLAYQTKQDMFRDLSKLTMFGGGLFVKSHEENTIFRQDKIRIVEYNIVCSCSYAEHDPRYNQAPYRVMITAMEIV